MFTINVLKRSLQSRIPLRTFRPQSVRRLLFRRPHGSPLPHTKKSFSLPSRRQRVSSSHKPILRHTDRHAIPVKRICLQLMPGVGSNTGETLRQPPCRAVELAGKPRSAQFLSGILKPGAVAVTMVLTANSPVNGSINIVTKTRLGLKLVRAAKKQPRILIVVRVVSSCLASVAFAVFIVYDLRNLSHDAPIDVEVKKTVREDPAAALSNARKELAMMLKGKDVTADREKRR